MELSAVTSAYTSLSGADLGAKDRTRDNTVANRVSSSNVAKPANSEGLNSQDTQRIQQEVQKLKQQEEKVKAHEAAHKAAGGQYASAAAYTYTPGPDGKSYITGGEVQIDMSEGRSAEETVRKMQIVQRAALAPSDPSGQDRAVAAQAAAIAAEAQSKKAENTDSTGSEKPENENGLTENTGVKSNDSENSESAGASSAGKEAAKQFSIYFNQDNSAGKILSVYS